MQSYEKWVATCLFLHPKEKDALALPSGVWYAIHVLFAIYTRLYCK